MAVKANPENNKIIEIAKGCIEVLGDKKVQDYIFLDLRKINSYLDYFLIATGNSIIHCKSLAKELQRYLNTTDLKERCKPDLNSEWIILDYNDIIIHIFTERMRDYYQLEKIWADADILTI
ncbi:ribosome silencing factor [Spirochaetota bacterium]